MKEGKDKERAGKWSQVWSGEITGLVRTGKSRYGIIRKGIKENRDKA